MSVAVSIDVSAVPERPAGAGRYVLELVRRLDPRDDLRLTVVARRSDRERWGLVAPRARLVAQAPAGRAARLLWEELALGPTLVLQRSVARGDRVQVHHAPHYTMPLSSPVPVVVTIHDLTFFDHPEWHERSKVLVFRHEIRRAARHAAALVCVSEQTADRMKALLRPAGSVHVVPHGVDSSLFNPTEPSPGVDEAVLGRLGVSRPYVLHVGTIEPRKGLVTLLRAFDRLDGATGGLTLVLAGAAGWGSEAFDMALAGMGQAERVVRLGYVDGEDLPSLMRLASAVAYPSHEEGFGLPALEALACGSPLVTTSGTVMGSVAGAAALLVPAGDAAALADAIEEAVAGAAGLESRRELGLEVAAQHSWESSAAAHARIYEEVAVGGRPRGGHGPRRK